ncbi:hypothetical protein Cflav_PD1562 [Pedosphaera parvula Ellin514]|uniref:Uncharacterized protein n=1 Tax=Pedosphaera parvula (strain Ellin514) TaxID=320771 RepID=B9XNA8_PEDPL|nr:hypothetical protein Cflav_PD1562 [Pedosphaera parvula Ellin514]
MSSTATQPKVRTFGFRFSATDAGIILVFIAVTSLLKLAGSPHAWILPIVACHFFLFCNVFRVRPRFELAWAGLFIVNVVTCSLLDKLEWNTVLLTQIPVTIIVILAEMKTPRYHGIFAARLNPRLPEYLRGEVP